MRPKSLALLALALGCGLVASIGISQVMDRNKGDVAETETSAIWVAKVDIPDQTAFTDENLVMEQWPKAKIPADAIVDPKEWQGARSGVIIYAGEAIIKKKLADPNMLAGCDIPTGYCAVPVAVDGEQQIGGLVKAHATVDVVVRLTKNPAMGIPESGVKTILRRIQVYAVDSTVKRTDSKHDDTSLGKVVTLLVTFKQAKEVTLAAGLGKIQLLLRNPNEKVSENESNDDSLVTMPALGNAQSTPVNEPKVPIITPPTNSIASTLTAPPAPREKNILDWFHGTENPSATNQPSADPSRPAPWSIMILEGTNVREVVFNDANGLPTSRKLYDNVTPVTPVTPVTAEPNK